MLRFLVPLQFNCNTFPVGSIPARVFAIAVAVGAACCVSATAHAQAGKLGAYVGMISATGTETGPKVSYRVSAKVNLPVSSRKTDAVSAEFLAGEAPNAIVTISQWDISDTEKSADSGGQFNSYTCTLAAPVEIPMSATGVLDLDLKARTHALSLTLLSTREIAFNCKHSRSGAFKKKQGVSLTLGTGAPGAQYQKPLPFTDAARLSAKYTLMPTSETKGHYGPIVQEWDLQFAR